MDPREKKWTNMFPKKPVIYNAQYSRPRDPRTFIFERSHVLEPVVKGYKLDKGDDNQKILNCLLFVQKFIKYTGDKELKGQMEFWQNPEDTLTIQKGDCIAEYEEIYTAEGIKRAKDIKVGDVVLSYDFDTKNFVYKPIVKVWDKGEKIIKRVHFRNGQYIDVTDEHHMLVRKNQKGPSEYEQVDLRDVDLTRWWKRKVPIAKKIPYKKSTPKWPEDLYIVIGHYIAEGHAERSHVQSSGYDLIEYIIPLLEENNIPFSEGTNNSGVPIISFLASEFKEYLKPLKRNSFDITLPEEIITLPEKYLEKLLYGMWLGDGTKRQYPDKRGYANNKEWTYSTSSKQLAEDIQRIGLHLGRTFHIWKQENHQGIGNQPIYRINYNSNSHFLKDRGYPDLGEVSIRWIEELKPCHTYDWEVKDTHNFVFKNGIITRQCEDGSILIKSLSLIAGVPDWKVRICAGHVKGGGHAYCTYVRDDDTQCVMDWCYWPNQLPVNKRPKLQDEKNYYEVWFSFNSRYTFAPRKMAYSKGQLIIE